MAQPDPFLAAQGLTLQGLTPQCVVPPGLSWYPGPLWTNIAADAALAAALLAGSAALALAAARRPHLNPHGQLYWFAGFVFLCAATGLAGIVPLREPWASVAGWLKLASAACAVPSMFLAWRILRCAVDAPSRDHLEAANRDLRDLNRRLEQCVATRTRALSSAGRRLVVAVHQAREADRIKTDFLARMSHELRTPLNAIIGFTEMLLSGVAGPLRDRQGEYCASVHAAGRQLLGQVDAILDVEVLRRGDIAPAPVREDLAAVCAAAVERHRDAARAAGVSLETEVAPGTVVWADPQALPTIVGNLVSNAVKYSPAGGSVRLLGAAVPDGVRIQVIDRGYGVDPGRVPHVFEPFYRAHERDLPAVGGSGLGLPLAKMLVEAHGGVIDFESEVGLGTTVTVRLPAEGMVEPSSFAADEATVMKGYAASPS